MGCIYILRNKKNQKCYVGQTTRKYHERLGSHLRRSRNGKGHLVGSAIRKYGYSSFDVFLFFVSDKHLDLMETEMIKRLDSLAPNGYNLESGGNKQKKMSESSKLKMSKNHNSPGHTGFKHSNEAKEKMRQKKLGKPGPWTGKKRPSPSEETKEKMRVAASKRKRINGKFI